MTEQDLEIYEPVRLAIEDMKVPLATQIESDISVSVERK